MGLTVGWLGGWWMDGCLERGGWGPCGSGKLLGGAVGSFLPAQLGQGLLFSGDWWIQCLA